MNKNSLTHSIKYINKSFAVKIFKIFVWASEFREWILFFFFLEVMIKFVCKW